MNPRATISAARLLALCLCLCLGTVAVQAQDLADSAPASTVIPAATADVPDAQAEPPSDMEDPEAAAEAAREAAKREEHAREKAAQSAIAATRPNARSLLIALVAVLVLVPAAWILQARLMRHADA